MVAWGDFPPLRAWAASAVASPLSAAGSHRAPLDGQLAGVFDAASCRRCRLWAV